MINLDGFLVYRSSIVWSIIPETLSKILCLQVVQKLVDIVHFLHLEIHEAFGSAGMHLKYLVKFLFIATGSPASFIHLFILSLLL